MRPRVIKSVWLERMPNLNSSGSEESLPANRIYRVCLFVTPKCNGNKIGLRKFFVFLVD